VKIFIGVNDPPGMFGPELVFRGAGSRIALFPKRLDKEVPFSIRRELLEDLPLDGHDDIQDLFLKPRFVLRRKRDFLVGGDRLKKGASGREDCHAEDPRHHSVIAQSLSPVCQLAGSRRDRVFVILSQHHLLLIFQISCQISSSTSA
jgi:hypothetical protein